MKYIVNVSQNGDLVTNNRKNPIKDFKVLQATIARKIKKYPRTLGFAVDILRYNDHGAYIGIQISVEGKELIES